MCGPVAFYSVAEVARLVSLSTKEIRREIARGHLLAKKHGRRLLIRSESVHAWINDGNEAARDETLRGRMNDWKLSGMRPARGGENRGAQALYAVGIGKKTDRTPKRPRS